MIPPNLNRPSALRDALLIAGATAKCAVRMTAVVGAGVVVLAAAPVLVPVMLLMRWLEAEEVSS